jgi:uncharacterized delta-60 repeat protein
MWTARSHLLTLVALCAAALAILVPTTAAARGHLDPTFGKGGHLVVKNELQEGRELGQVAPTVGGPIYFTEDTYACRNGSQAPCHFKETLRRFEPNGTVDPTYDPGNHVFPGQEQEVELIADSNGLPVFGWEREHRVHLRRLLASGELDQSFGDGGTVTLGCRCTLEGFEATAGGGLLVSASVRRAPRKGREPEPVTFLFERLRANGSPDPGFGHGGTARVRTKNWSYAAATPGHGGSAFLTGEINHHGPHANFFATRLTPRGSLDRSFGKAAVAAARGAYAHDTYLWEGLYAFPWRQGVELFSSAFETTVILGLRANGHLDPDFGHDGETRLHLGVPAAASAGRGRLFVVGNHGYGWYVQLVDRDGRRDRRFGSLLLPGGGSEYGLWIYPDGPDRAIVVSPGESICRQECPSDPRIYRVLD